MVFWRGGEEQALSNVPVTEKHHEQAAATERSHPGQAPTFTRKSRNRGRGLGTQHLQAIGHAEARPVPGRSLPRHSAATGTTVVPYVQR